MQYVDFGEIQGLVNKLYEYGLYQCENGNETAVVDMAAYLERVLQDNLEKLKAMPQSAALREAEPDDLESIRKLRVDGPRTLPRTFSTDKLADKMAGAVLGRFAACTLGVPVENWPIPAMREFAACTGATFPPEDYWPVVDRPHDVQYGAMPRWKYSRSKLDGVPVDDDITYTLLNLLVLEQYGYCFTTDDVGMGWLQHLPCACTAEDVALQNLKKGIPVLQAGEIDNPYAQWIGADIRSDAFGYAAACRPEIAAEMAYRDAYLSHRGNGIYGEMLFAAAQAAAFAVDDPLEAVRIGLTEIPKTSRLYEEACWALDTCGSLTDYEQARQLIDRRFAGMHCVHTINNACLTIFGLALGGGDFSRTTSLLVAMGLDNDCTAATAGSIVGAIVGKDSIAPHWIRPFHDTVHTYMNDIKELQLGDVIRRFVKLAENCPEKL